ncbi:CDP-glycerol glycerophosphotransferase family protein [Thiohalobacter sp. IOR34]|uniref:CDP-glycerol glycerophosphotransferase family protein n=1 Tax=Thiohalobacter sp. IOR34 TaxID=3057176 RepID=UPI0025B01FC0|nr:CDP-glycerol glycerophosphotransferase family protein [Thiohalobacter sp. IOR34]WJW76703.1 CDP-glycerol glycerophosphotransferase family protein [Thiohalobacter sp. IOR34]
MLEPNQALFGRTIVLTAIDGYHLRSFFNTGIIDRLLAAGVQVRCVCTHAGEELVSMYEQRGVSFYFIEPRRPGILEWLLLAVAGGIFRRLVPDQTLICYRVNSRWIRRLVASTAGLLLPFRSVYRILDRRIRCLRNDRAVRQFFDEAPCDLLVAGTPGWKYPELPFIREAIQRGIPTLCQILSWDNLSMKGPFGITPDRIMVWNRHMKRLAVEHFYLRPEQVFVTGAPQFDIYHRSLPNKPAAKYDISVKCGINPEKYQRVLMIAGIPTVLAPFQGALVREITTLARAGTWGKGVAVVFRPHPQSTLEEYDLPDTEALFVNDPHEYIEDSKADIASRWRFSSSALSELAQSLRGADVVITVASSMTLDSAAVGTPVVNVAYDPGGQFPGELLESYYRSSHYRFITDSGVVPIARSTPELIEAITTALDEPDAMASRQKSLTEEICGPFTANAAERQADIILEMLKSNR